jgi:hypothetical protein
MAKESRTTKALTGPRQLKEMVPYYYGIYEDGIGYPGMNGWINPGVGAAGNYVYYESTIDVNLALDDLTMFPQAAILQDPGLYFRTEDITPSPIFNSLQVIDIISIKRLDTLAIKQAFTNARCAAPGMIGTTDDFNQIIMGSWRLMSSNSNLGQQANIQITVDAKDFSSASPFAQDKLWVYRILLPMMTDLTASVVGAPASRFILNVMVGQEKDLPYIMRLKNSYELQQL